MELDGQLYAGFSSQNHLTNFHVTRFWYKNVDLASFYRATDSGFFIIETGKLI